MPGNRYPKKLFDQQWTFKPCRGRQRKCWSRVVNDLFSALGHDKADWLQDIQSGGCSVKGFLSIVGDCVVDRKFEEGLNSKVKLSLYKTFNKVVEFKEYLHGVSDCLSSGQGRMG